MADGLMMEAKRKGQSASVRDELVHLHGYFDDRRAGLCYLLQTSQGLDIDSGSAEGAPNQVLQPRMKRARMRWDRPGGAAMAALRCANRSTGAMTALQKQFQLSNDGFCSTVNEELIEALFVNFVAPEIPDSVALGSKTVPPTTHFPGEM